MRSRMVVVLAALTPSSSRVKLDVNAPAADNSGAIIDDLRQVLEGNLVGFSTPNHPAAGGRHYSLRR